MAATLQEYLVSLGAEVDEKGIAKIHKALSTTKMAAVGVTTALAAVVTMIAKTSVKLDETSQKYEQMARAQKKSTEEIRAQETALKVMGKTLKEVKADKVLNAQYKALLKVGKGLALPEASGGTLVLRDIISTIEELKVKGTYALQWINHYLLNKLYLPLSRLRDGLRNFSMKLSANFPSWMEKIATGLSYVVRLVGAGIEGMADLVGWIAKLPPEIKMVGEAIGIAFGASKLGPVGMTIAAITGLLLLLEDFYTWKNGTGPSRLGDFWQSISDGTLLSPEGVQAFLGRLDEVFGSVTEKVGQFLDIGTDITGKITEGIASFDAEAAGKTLSDVVSKIILGIEGVVNGNDTRFYDFAQSARTLVTTMLGKVTTALGTFLGSAEWGQMLEGALTMGANFINGVFDLLLGVEGAEGTKAQQGLVDTLVRMLQSVVDGLGNGLKKISFEGLGERTGAFITGLFEKIGGFFTKEGEEDAPIKKLLGKGMEVIKTAITGIIDFFMSFLSGINYSEVKEGIGSAIDTILGWARTALTDKEKGILAVGTDIAKKITEGISNFKPDEAGKTLADFLQKIVIGILAVVDGSNTQFYNFAASALEVVSTLFEKIAETIGSFLSSAEWGTMLEGAFNTAGGFLENVLDLVLGKEGAEGTDTERGLANTIINILRNIVRWFSEGLEKISFTGLGEKVGTFLNKLFKRISGFLEDHSEGNTLIGDVATAAGKIVKGIVDLIGSFFSSIDTDTIKDFADKLWGSIQNGIADLSRRLKGEGEDAIDTEGIGAGIGEAIGNAISIGLTFLTKFCADALAWLTSSEGQESLQSIGTAIVNGIVAGMVAVGDAIGALIFGEDQWKEWQDLAKNQQAVNAGEISSDEYTPEELMIMSGENPEQFAQVAAQSQDWTDWMRDTNDKYGFPNSNSRNIGWNMNDLYFQNSNLGFFPVWWEEWGKWRELTGMRDTAVKNQDRTSYEQALAGLQAFTTGFKGGLRREDLYSSVDEAMGTVKVKGDNSQAQEAIKETEESLDNIDGKEAETTIYVNRIQRNRTITGTATEDQMQTKPPDNALGGRFSIPTVGRYGEDGTEYIIPITKPSRARGLILQMFQEMGSHADSILNDLGVPMNGAESIGGPGQPYYRQPAGMYPSVGGSGSVKNNSDNTVTAPTTINVYGSSDPERTGREAAQASARNIIRRVRGCFEG